MDPPGARPETIKRGSKCTRCATKRTVIHLKPHSLWAGALCALCLAEMLHALLYKSLGQRLVKGMV